jgi:MerR family copper efflux transcriptional regulator
MNYSPTQKQDARPVQPSKKNRLTLHQGAGRKFLCMKGMTIGQLARKAGVKVSTVRYYERRRLFAEPCRGNSGYRQYVPESVACIRFIRRAQGLGFSLQDIRELLALRISSEATCGDIKHAAEVKLADIEAKIRSLAVLPAIGVALLPKLTCPACRPAYAGVLSALGLGFVNYTPFLLPLTVLFLLLSVVSLVFAAQRRIGGRTAGPGSRRCSHCGCGQVCMGLRRRDIWWSGVPCGRIALEHLAGPEGALFSLRRWRRQKSC